MARIQGVPKKKAGLFVRFAYWMTKRKLGKVITPITIKAHHPRILRGYAHMEMGQQAGKSLPKTLKALMDLKVASLVGCPF